MEVIERGRNVLLKIWGRHKKKRKMEKGKKSPCALQIYIIKERKVVKGGVKRRFAQKGCMFDV
jgi:hypothetical protein